MRDFLGTGCLFVLTFVISEPIFSQTAEDALYREWIEYRGGEVSMAFDQAPVEFVVTAIYASTGFQIVLPPAVEHKLLNLRLTRLPLEPAVRSLLSKIGFKNFAVMYDDTGHPKQAVVIGSLRDPEDAEGDMNDATQSAEPAVQVLTATEADKLQKELERWSELSQEERGRIEDRLKALPPSEERERLLKEYGRQMLGLQK
jgi:hypothetical protein